MASVSKIAANRRNASRSTGPRSRIRKSRARRNAVRHGLAARAVLGAEEAASVQGMADQIVDGSSGVLSWRLPACVVAQAELDLVRIRELESHVNSKRHNATAPEPWSRRAGRRGR